MDDFYVTLGVGLTAGTLLGIEVGFFAGWWARGTKGHDRGWSREDWNRKLERRRRLKARFEGKDGAA